MKEYDSVVKQIVEYITNSENGDIDEIQDNILKVLTNEILPVVIAKKQLEILDEQILELRKAFADGSMDIPFTFLLDEKRIFGALVMLITDRYQKKDEEPEEEKEDNMEDDYIPSNPA